MPYFRSKIKHGNSKVLKNMDNVGVTKTEITIPWNSMYHS